MNTPKKADFYHYDGTSPSAYRLLFRWPGHGRRGYVRSYTQISQDEAKEMMEQDDGHVIVDVRRPDEFAAGHIPRAICIPNETIESEQPEELPDLDQAIRITSRRTMISLISNFRKTRWTGYAVLMNREGMSIGDRKGLR